MKKKDIIVNLNIPIEYFKDKDLMENIKSIKEFFIPYMKEVQFILNRLGSKEYNYIVVCTPFHLYTTVEVDSCDESNDELVSAIVESINKELSNK